MWSFSSFRHPELTDKKFVEAFNIIHDLFIFKTPNCMVSLPHFLVWSRFIHFPLFNHCSCKRSLNEPLTTEHAVMSIWPSDCNLLMSKYWRKNNNQNNLENLVSVILHICWFYVKIQIFHEHKSSLGMLIKAFGTLTIIPEPYWGKVVTLFALRHDEYVIL